MSTAIGKISLLLVVVTASSALSANATTIAAPPQDQEFEQSWVTGRVTIRSGPGTNYRAINRLKRGDFVNVGDCRRGWCYVDVYGGGGYIPQRTIGDGENPYNEALPAEPGHIPRQEPGTLFPID